MLPISIQRAKVTEHFLQESRDHVVLRDDRVWQEQLHPALIKFCVALRNDMALGTEGEPVNAEAREMNAYAHKI